LIDWLVGRAGVLRLVICAGVCTRGIVVISVVIVFIGIGTSSSTVVIGISIVCISRVNGLKDQCSARRLHWKWLSVLR